MDGTCETLGVCDGTRVTDGPSDGMIDGSCD